MRRRRVLLALTSAASLALAACSILTGLDADYTLQAQAGGDDADVGDESSTPITEAGTDGTGPVDAAYDGDAGPFCAQHKNDPGLVFCHDFEQSLDAVANGFTDSNETSGSLDVSPGTGVGGSLALRAKVTGPAGSGNVYVHKVLDEPDGAPATFGEFNEHELSFAFAFDNVTTLYTSLMGSLGYGAVTSLTRVGVSDYTNAGANNVDVSDPPGSLNGPSVKVAVGEWRRAIISLKRPSRTMPYVATVTVQSLDGATSVEVYRATAFDGGVLSDGGSGPVHLLLGSFFTSSVAADGGVTNRIDDVLYRRTR